MFAPDDPRRNSRPLTRKEKAIARNFTVLSGSLPDVPTQDAAMCKWSVDDDGIWNTDCGNAFFFDSDGPHENGFKFCPYCGKGMDAVHAPD